MSTSVTTLLARTNATVRPATRSTLTAAPVVTWTSARAVGTGASTSASTRREATGACVRPATGSSATGASTSTSVKSNRLDFHMAHDGKGALFGIMRIYD